MATQKVTEKPVVYEARQVDSDDKESDWVLVNTNNPEDVRNVTNEQYRAQFQRSRAKADPVPNFDPDSDPVDPDEE